MQHKKYRGAPGTADESNPLHKKKIQNRLNVLTQTYAAKFKQIDR